MSDQTFGFKCLRCGRTDLHHIKITNGGDWVCPGCWTDADWCRLGPSPKDAEIAALRAENEALKGEVERWKGSVREVEAHLEASQKWGEQEQINRLAAEARGTEAWASFEQQRARALAAEAALESLRGEVREVVGEVEWEGQDMGRACCPLCGGLVAYEPPHKHSFILKDDTFGHAPDCRLAALLKRVGP